jgi:putative membrane protein
MPVLGYEPSLPYCGAPPDPASLWGRWNLDPTLILALALLAGLHLLAARRSHAAPRTVAIFLAGWAIAALALVSPLCPLSVSLFSARVGQHMLLTLIAAPLVALGRPDRLIGGRIAAWLSRSPLLAAAAFTVLLWVWHAPAPYGATFSSTATYWAMHVSLIGSAIWLWLSLLPDGPRPAAAIGAGFAVSVQMGLLGALITLAPRAVYAPHLLTTQAWGLSPLQDQQLGGAIMWVPGCLVFLAAALLGLARMLGRFDWRDAPSAMPADA